MLLLFCTMTYAVAPVAGFAWLLLVMGIVQCEPRQTTVRALYLTVFSSSCFTKSLCGLVYSHNTQTLPVTLSEF
jgi:hypothetical protein